MRSHRLTRLAGLTQGLALVGFGLAELACGKEPNTNAPMPPQEPHINATAIPTPSATPSGTATNDTPAPSASASSSSSAKPLATGTPPKPQLPHTNSPPQSKP